MSATSIIKVIITGDDVGLRKAALGSAAELEKTGKAGGGMGKMLGLGFAGAALAAGAFALSAVKSADEFDLAHARLQVAVKDSGARWDVYSGQLQAAINKGTDFGFHITDTTNALAQATTGTGSATKAMQLLPLAMDIARARNLDLGTAMLAVTKASEGQTKALKQAGIDLPIAVGGAVKLKTAHEKLAAALENLVVVEQKIHDGRIKAPAAAAALTAAEDKVRNAQEKVNTVASAGALIIEGLTKRYGGSASAASDTFAGKVDVLKAKFDAFKVSVGLTIEKGLVGLSTWYDTSGHKTISHLGADLGPVISGFQTAAGAVKSFNDFLNHIPSISGKSGGNWLSNTLGGAADLPNALRSAWNSIPGMGGSAHRAAGGPVTAGMGYMVGERGPEFFRPASSGSIVPNHALGGSGGTVIINMPAGVDPDAVMAAQRRYNRRNGIAA